MNALRHQATRGLNALWYGRNPARWLLWPIAIVIRGLAVARRKAYRLGLMRSLDVGVPVIVVGNLTVGGTGKTPLTIWLARQLRERGFRVGIVCRGYGGAAKQWPQLVTPDSDAALVGDEAVLLAQRSGCPVCAGPDRVAAARRIARKDALDVILSDDGLQHYRLKRAVEIVVIDGARGLGNELCLPAGPLREPASRLADVDAVVVNGGTFGHAGFLHADMRATRVVELATGNEATLEEFAGRSVNAAAAIGNPERFFDMLDAARLIVEPHAYADHEALTGDELDFGDGLPVLVTEKDAVKLAGGAARNVWCVMAELTFSSGHGERLLRILDRLLERQSAA